MLKTVVLVTISYVASRQTCVIWRVGNVCLLVHGQVIIIFVVSVCLSVCLCRVFSAVFDPISIKLGHMLYVWVELCSLEYSGCATTRGWVTPKKLVFLGVLGLKNYLVLQF